MRDAEAVRYLILAVQREGNRQLSQSLRPLGVTPSQAEVVRLLAERQPLTLTALGELLVCESGTNPSRLVDRLVGVGLIQRLVDEQDRRQVRLTLTVEGERIASQIAEIEELLYGWIDAAGTGHDVSAALAYLRDLVGDRPAGVAVARRRELTTPTGRPSPTNR